MQWYRNVSKRVWRRPDGRRVEPMETFQATVREHARIQRRGYRGCLLAVDPPVTTPSAAAENIPATPPPPQPPTAPSDIAPVWTLSMGPETYLRVHPTGPNAPLAHEVIEYRKRHGAG